MNIGLVSQALPYLPSRGGFRLYGGNLIRQLSKRHNVHLVSLMIDDDADHLDWARQHCASVRTIRTGQHRWFVSPLSAVSSHVAGKPLAARWDLRKTLREVSGAWDVVHVEGGYAGGIMPARLPYPMVLSLHDSWTLRCNEMLECAQSAREKLYYRFRKYTEPRYEQLVYPRFDCCTVVADPDVREVRRTVPAARVELIPYGTDTEYFHPVDVPKEPRTLVFHSHLGYAPNIEAALELADDILPRVREKVPDAALHLIGANPDPKITKLASRPGINVSANVPDLRPAVCSGQVYACPIRHGAGLKSKMLEAMAMRMPIVGYPGAIVGLSGTPGKHYLLATTPDEFAAHVVDLLQHPRRADELADAGRDLVEREYSWESRALAYEDLYRQLIEQRKRGVAAVTRNLRPATVAGSQN